MKKVIFAIVISIITIGYAMADNITSNTFQVTQHKAEDFIKQHFSGIDVVYTEYDEDDFEVRLANGIKIEFYVNGDWKEIKAYGNYVPKSILPKFVAETLDKAYPQATVIKVEKEWNGYEIKLNNMTKLLIDNNGTLLGKKTDK